MPPLTLSAAFAENAMTEPILSGRVTPQAISWRVSAVHPSEMFWRQLKFGEFDVSEMSLSSLAIEASRGIREWVPIPVFTTRRFFHTGIVVRPDAGIASPADLAGRRVGVPEYQQTAAVWTRGALQHEFGVAPTDMTWFMERRPELSHGGATSFTPPPGVDLSYVAQGANLGSLLEAGELDAAVVYIVNNNLIDRSRAVASTAGRIRKLFGEPEVEERRYYEKTGLLPVNHVVVIRKSLLDEHPWIALNVYSAFVAAKREVYQSVLDRLALWRNVMAVPAEQIASLRNIDPVPYGVASQRPVLAALGRYLFEQGLTDREVEIVDLFPASTKDL